MKLNLSYINKKQIIILIAVLSLMIFSTGYFYYGYEKNNIRKTSYDELKAIADLKEGQIRDWLKDKQNEAAATVQSLFFVEGVEKWILNKSDITAKQNLIKRLLIAVKVLGNENVFLASVNGQIYLSAETSVESLDNLTISKIEESVNKRDIVLTDFYYCKKENKIHYDIIAPIINQNNGVIAVLVYRIDPEKFLYPLIQNWPTQSPSSETAILKVENDSILFLNELRHRKNTALKLKIPLTRTEIPAVQAALGRSGQSEGIDYRGIKVLSDIRIIPENNWIMLSKVDKKEIYSDLHIKAIVIGLFCFLVVTVIGLGFFWIYNKRQRNIYLELYNKEKALLQEQQKFKITMDSIGDGIITSDINGNIEFMNKYAEELTGWNFSNAKGRHLNEVYLIRIEETGEKENNIFEEVIKHGIVKENPDNSFLISKSGKEISVLYTGAPIHSTYDKVVGVVITFRDITKQKLAEQALKKSEALFSKTFHSSPSGIAISRIDDGKFVNVNNAACILYGYSREELLGRSSLDLGLLDYDTRLKLVDDLKAHGKLRSRDLTLHTGTGELKEVLFSWEPIEYAGESCAIASIIDISDRKQLEIERISKEAAIQANLTKSEFLANMSHEIRTPMNAVLGYTELLSSTLVDKTQKDYIRSIQSSGRSLLTLINDILDLSKIEAGKLELEYDYIDTNSFFSEFERIFSLKLTEKGLKFILDITSGTPAGIYIDEARVRQIVFNLIGNAIKFTSEGKIALKVFTENPQVVHYSKDKSEELIDLIIEVKDTGIGISKELQEAIFEPFVQERDYKNYGGTGLGLAITRRLTSLMNGSITVRSDLGKGSIFTVRIPEITFQRDFSGTNIDIQIDPAEIIFEEAVILIADDVEHNRSYLRDALRNTKLKIFEAEDGIAGYKLAKKIVPDLIITDIRMPKMDGFQLLNKIKTDKKLKHIPVIAYSASVLKAQKELIHNSDFVGLLIKPVKVTELYLELMNILPYKSTRETKHDKPLFEVDFIGEISDLPVLIQSLETGFYATWETFAITQPINGIRDFGNNLVQLGTDHNSSIIKDYGRELIIAADSYNIEAILNLISKYTGIIDKLKDFGTKE